MSSVDRSVVVTGVSTGLGHAIASDLMRNGFHVFGSVRKPEDANRLSAEFQDRFTPLIFDVTDAEAIQVAADQVAKALNGRTLAGLVNNAGVAVAGPLRYLPVDELKFQFDVNVYGLLRVSQAFIPLLGADPAFSGAPGRIINMSSVHGEIAMPIFGPYSMSKHAVEAFSGALRRELLGHGIDVVTVGPGAVKTPIWQKSDNLDIEQYKGTEYYDTFVGIRSAAKQLGETGLEPSEVSGKVVDILEGKEKGTRFAVVAKYLADWLLPRILPQRLVDKKMTQRMGFPSSYR
ncbi:SDR family NAD(P)-dependent oxidoreductase [Ruegeria jejuensis]|uniref:SDR family NAD(P)-dependent oxidoreductase n=1 Tax=Ruegeria jejuensis TaxID=3233338 RepID=UPI00355AE106